MPLQSGTRLGPYEVVAPMGAAGDERYKATDTRADRLVTIKVLPPGQSVPEEARARLERDAKTISSLGHPHISVPVEIGHEDPSTDFVVSQHAEGETLAERLARGPMDLHEALQVAIAVADSLDKAHRRGIVHGGLSPFTVVMAADGPKLLDFGLAGLSEPSRDAHSAGEPAWSPSMALTRTSATLAAVPQPTAAYLAPEQLAGAPADPRSDIFACGALLYEMVTGRPAFREKTQALLVAAIQSVDPDPVSALRPTMPAVLDHVVRRCLSKDPRQRLQTAWDLLTQLRWIAEGSGSQVGAPVPALSRSKTQERVLWAAAAVAGVMAVSLAPSATSSFRAAPEADTVRFTVSGLERNAGVPVTISPDGRWVAGTPQGGSEILGVSLGSVTPQRLVSNSDIVFQPFWSPDSRSIAFFGRGGGGLLQRAEIAGGPPQTISEAPPPVGNGTWNREGVILFSSAGLIHRVLAAGGEPTPVTGMDENGKPITGEDHLGPWFLPDGRHFLYVAVSSDSAIYLADLGSHARTRLIGADSKPMYAEPGYILFNRGATLFAQPFDAKALRLAGEPIRVTDGVAMLAPTANPNMSRTANFWVSQTGALVFKSVGAGLSAAAAPANLTAQRSLVWVNRSGQETAEAGTGAFAGVDLASDGRRFAVHLHEGSGGDIWTFDPDQGRMQRFTFNASQENSSPIWSPDGKQVAYASLRDNQWGLYVRQADGTGTEALATASAAQKLPMSWSPDGKWLVYGQAGMGLDVWTVPLEGDKKPVAVLASEFNETHPQVSPDGRWIAYQSNETGVDEIYIKQFPEGPAKRQVSTGGAVLPRWRGDGRELYFLTPGGISAVDIDTSGPSPRPGVARSLFGIANPSVQGHFGVYHRFAVSSDGQRFLISRPGGGRGQAGGGGGGIDAAVRQQIDGPAGGGAGALADITVVLNWPQMLKQRAK